MVVVSGTLRARKPSSITLMGHAKGKAPQNHRGMVLKLKFCSALASLSTATTGTLRIAFVLFGIAATKQSLLE